MYRWCVKHGILAMLLWALPVSIICFFMFYFIGIPLYYWALFVAFETFTAWGFVLSCANQVVVKASKSLNDDCDPYPLMEATNELLSNTLISKTRRQVLFINKAVALREIGEFEGCFEILKNLNIDKYASVPIYKILYYMNLSDAYMNLNKMTESELMLRKANQIFQDARLSKRNKFIFERYLKLNQFAIEFKNGIYDGMEEFLLALNKEALSKRFLISSNMATVELYLKTNKTDIAKEYLQFVIVNGNKLHDAARAKEIMAAIEE